MNSYEIGNRSIATTATTEARSTEGGGVDTGDVVRGKVLAVSDGNYTVAALDENGLATQIYALVTSDSEHGVNDVVSLKVDAMGNAVVLSGGGSSCAVSLNSFGVLFG